MDVANDLLFCVMPEASVYTGWAKKLHCYNFAYSQSIFIIFGTYTL